MICSAAWIFCLKGPYNWTYVGGGTKIDATAGTSTTPRGWLSESERSRVVRFTSETKVEGNHKIFVPFQTTGFIFLMNDTFTVSVAEPNDVLLFKYKDGLLSRTDAHQSADPNPKKMNFSDAISSALDESVCNGIGKFCKVLLSERGRPLTASQKWYSSPTGALYEVVVGTDSRDLQKLTVSWPSTNGDRTQTLSTFSVILK